MLDRILAAPGIPGLIVERPVLSDLHSDKPETTPTEIPASQLNTGFRVIARQGLLLRGGPGTEFEVLTKLALNRRVFRLSAQSDWYKVDLEGDGLADGFCHSAYLVPDD